MPEVIMNLEKTIEEQTCLDIINLHIKEAIDLIRSRNLTFHVLEQDRQFFPRTDPCFISDRINLFVRRNRVVGTLIF